MGARVVVHHVARAEDGRVSCVVRCTAGSVRPGTVFDTAASPGGAGTPVAVRVTALLRYGRAADLLDPPHSALLDLDGTGLHHLREGAGLSAGTGGC